MNTPMNAIEKLESALRTERDTLRQQGNKTAANAIVSFLAEADTDSKQRLYDIIMRNDPDPEPPATVPVEVTDEGVMTITAQVEVPFERVVDMIVGAIEGGSAYWCNRFKVAPQSQTIRAEIREKGGNIWYSEAEFWTRGGVAYLEFDKPTADHSSNATIGLTQLRNGLSVMAQVAPRHFADLVNETDDATTSDVFLQCVLFGEIIFG